MKISILQMCFTAHDILYLPNCREMNAKINSKSISHISAQASVLLICVFFMCSTRYGLSFWQLAHYIFMGCCRLADIFHVLAFRRSVGVSPEKGECELVSTVLCYLRA